MRFPNDVRSENFLSLGLVLYFLPFMSDLLVSISIVTACRYFRQHIGSRYIEVFKGHPADMQVCS